MRKFIGRSVLVFATCGLTAALLLVAGGCSSLKVVESWHKPVAQTRPYQKVMIIAIARDEVLRKTFENLVVDEMLKRQIMAVASHTFVPEAVMSSREAIVAAVHASGCDAVLTTRPAEGVGAKVTQDGQGSVYGAGARSAYGFHTAMLQTNLYDSSTQELVWTATVKTFDAEKEARVSRELGLFFFESLRRDGFL
jgi:hypothetical protein